MIAVRNPLILGGGIAGMTLAIALKRARGSRDQPAVDGGRMGKLDSHLTKPNWIGRSDAKVVVDTSEHIAPNYGRLQG